MNAIKRSFTLIILLGIFTNTQAEVPKLINYQGKLTTAEGGCVDTTVQMQFSIYTDSTGDDQLWSEIQSAVQVKEGVFNVLLGSDTEIPDSVFTGDIRYLGVKVEEDPEMTPRKAIVSVPYSYKSTHADTASHLGVWPPFGKVYDSGWFEVARSQIYALAHNLGTTRIISELWFSTSSDGSSAIRLSTMERAFDDACTASLKGLTTTHISVQTGRGHLAAAYSGTGDLLYYTSGYYRLILMALE